MRIGGMAAAASALLLAGCVGSSDGGNVTVTAPAGLTLPLQARTMLYISQRDLERPLIIEATRFRNEETSVKDGRVLERSARAMLSQAFSTLDTNNTAMKPQVVVKVMGTPKFSRLNNIMKIGCGVDVLQADGALLGSFVARYDSKDTVDFKDALEPGYKLCLKSAVDQMLASPAIARYAQKGFPEPNPAGYRSYMESLGLRP